MRSRREPIEGDLLRPLASDNSPGGRTLAERRESAAVEDKHVDLLTDQASPGWTTRKAPRSIFAGRLGSLEPDGQLSACG
jgi:hypothetical protein